MKIVKKIKTAVRVSRQKGLAGVANKLGERRRIRETPRRYEAWLAANSLDDARRDEIRATIADFPRKPLISVVMPVYNVGEEWLRRCIDSVFAQLYDHWELCIADDKSPAPHVRAVLGEYERRDQRVKVEYRAENGHISKASNSALALATGEFTVLLDHDDELSPDALFHVADEILRYPDTAFIYSDEDMIDESGRRYDGKFKPDFSRDLLYSMNMITHLSAYRTDKLRAIGGFREGVEGSQDFDLALRFIETIDERQIRHIPRILYHWRAIAGSVALSSDEKPYAHERAREALRDHFARTGRSAEVVRGNHQFHRVRYTIPTPAPTVAIISESTDRLANATAYENFEIAVATEFASAALNRAVAASTADVLVFVGAGLVPGDAAWLAELVSFAIQPEIGAVGGKVVDENFRVARAGVIVGFDGLAAHAHEGYHDEADGNFLRLCVAGNFSAVAIDCLAVRRELFDELGGFDEANLPTALFDVDFCLRLGERGKRIVFTPFAELRGRVKKSRAPQSESVYFQKRWRETIVRDPFYNPNLEQTGETFRIKTAP